MITKFIIVIMVGYCLCFLKVGVPEELEGMAKENFPGAVPHGPPYLCGIQD